jgi:hypothetical protein
VPSFRINSEEASLNNKFRGRVLKKYIQRKHPKKYIQRTQGWHWRRYISIRKKRKEKKFRGRKDGT